MVYLLALTASPRAHVPLGAPPFEIDQSVFLGVTNRVHRLSAPPDHLDLLCQHLAIEDDPPIRHADSLPTTIKNSPLGLPGHLVLAIEGVQRILATGQQLRRRQLQRGLFWLLHCPSILAGPVMNHIDLRMGIIHGYPPVHGAPDIGLAKHRGEDKRVPPSRASFVTFVLPALQKSPLERLETIFYEGASQKPGPHVTLSQFPK